MAESIEITRQERPVNFRQKSTINPDNLERNFRHADDEINKIYQLLGGNGIISQASIRTVVISGGGGSGGGGAGAPVDGKFLMIGNDARFPNERAFISNQGIQQVDGGANGNLTLQLDINSLAVDTIVAGDFLAFEDIGGGLDNKVTVADLNAVIDHGGLAGLSDDDHSQYALLAGRSSGQTLIGGTGTTDDLILRTTSGIGESGADMIFQVGNNGATEAMRILNSGRVGIGTVAPNAPLQVTDYLDFANAEDTSFALGFEAGNSAISGAVFNTFVGYRAGTNNTDGEFNTFIGYLAGTGNIGGRNNVAIGTRALEDNTTGLQNVAIGLAALSTSINSNLSTAVGSLALQDSTGAANTAVGGSAMLQNSTGIRNTAVGANALAGVHGSSTGQRNLAVGYASGVGWTSGHRNLLLGYAAGDNLTSGSNNLIIGYDVDVPIGTSSFQMVIGNLIFSENVDGTGTTLSAGNLGIGVVTPLSKLHVVDSDAVTNTVVNVFQLDKNSTGTPANGYGLGILLTGESSITEAREMSRLISEWSDATDATRTALSKWSVYDTAEREGIRIEANGSAPMIGFLGATAVVRPASTDDLKDALVALGLYTAGGATPLNLDGGTLTASNIHTTEGRILNSTRITGSTILDATHHNVFCDTNGGAFTVTLSAGVDGTIYRIINSGSSGNNITLVPDGSENLLGANSNLTLLDGNIIIIVYESTEGWW